MPAAGYAYAKLKYICITEVMNGQRGVMASLVDSTKVVRTWEKSQTHSQQVFHF